MQKTKKKVFMYIILIFILLVVPFIFSLFTENPEGTSIEGKYFNPNKFEFLTDLSYKKDGETIREHEIFEKEIQLINDAQEFLIIDCFLYNDEYNKGDITYPEQVKEMTDAMIAKKASTDIPIVFITDPLNNFYGAYTQEHIQRLIDGGIDVIVTDHDKMKDSNPLFSGLYRFYIKRFGVSQNGFIPNFFEKGGPKVSISSILKLINFKGNHRKVYINENEAIISSSNPHDPSAFHSNVAVKFSGTGINDLIESEKTVVEFSGETFPDVEYVENISFRDKSISMRVLTEKAIFNALRGNITEADEGDKINIAMFYLSDSRILNLLSKMSQKGVEINIIADPNKDAFGIEKNGSPNRSALSELSDKNENINVRWYNTHGEQFHTKMATFFYNESNETKVILGSANFTRRNLMGYNLETDVEIVVSKDHELSKELEEYFSRIWNNEAGEYTLPLSSYYENRKFMELLWKFQEFIGLCTW